MPIEPPPSQVKNLLESIKETFWLDGQQSGVSESEIKEQWTTWAQCLEPVLASTSPAAAAQHPTSSVPPSSDLTSEVGPVSMQRCRTDQPIMQPAQPTLSCSPTNPRKRSNSSSFAPSHPGQMSAPPLLPAAAPAPAEPEEGSRKMARTASAPRPTSRVAKAVVYEDPADWVAKHRTLSGSPSFPKVTSQQHVPIATQRLAGSPTSPSPLSSSYNSSAPPLTPDSAGIHSGTLFSPAASMSRQGSLGGDFRLGFSNALTFQSPSSDDSQHTAMPVQRIHGYSSASSHSFRGDMSEQGQFADDARQQIPNIAVSAPDPSLLASLNRQAPGNDVTRPRQASISSLVQREYQKRPKNIAIERPLKPKIIGTDAQQLAGCQMIRSSSDNGVTVEKYCIPKAPYNRPQKEKLKCQFCNKHPNGFRGDHELRRHVKLHHSSSRSAWRCIDGSDEGTWLSSCKHCRDGKLYGAYYNAAAHLRRVHFNPKQAGRKGRGSPPERAGKGGGDWPAMEELKSKWIQEMQIEADGSVGPAMLGANDAEEMELAEEMAATDRAQGLAVGDNYSMPFDAADTGMFSFDGSFDYGLGEPSFDELGGELFDFEEPNNSSG